MIQIPKNLRFPRKNNSLRYRSGFLQKASHGIPREEKTEQEYPYKEGKTELDILSKNMTQKKACRKPISPCEIHEINMEAIPQTFPKTLNYSPEA